MSPLARDIQTLKVLTASFGEFLKGTFISLMRLFLGLLELLAAGGRLGDADNQALPIGGDVQGSFNAYLQQIENWPINDQCQTVPVFCQRFDHGACISNVAPIVSLNTFLVG